MGDGHWHFLDHIVRIGDGKRENRPGRGQSIENKPTKVFLHDDECTLGPRKKERLRKEKVRLKKSTRGGGNNTEIAFYSFYLNSLCRADTLKEK